MIRMTTDPIDPDVLRRELFGGNPYANSPFSTPEVVAKLTREDVLAFAADRIRRQHVVVVSKGGYIQGANDAVRSRLKQTKTMIAGACNWI